MSGRRASDRFEQVLGAPPPPELADGELLPSRWARAAATSLPVDGAGLSLHDPEGLRIPLGSSDPVTALAERLQFTYGDGPCLRAHDTGEAITFDEAAIRRNWPEFHDALVGGTPLRAVLATPLLPPLGPSLVLDLYLRDPAAMRELDREAVEEVTVSLTRHVVQAVTSSAGADDMAWWRGPEARARTRVWQAMGMVSVARSCAAADALALLKARAFAAGRVVDDVAADLVEGRLSPADLETVPGPG